ncbi:hypothetical protein C8J56DRAFT_1089833 [Mycena floridula]|nr:hypothetical protein C8J56DRAFT_1089833 [Mycena floridula]
MVDDDPGSDDQNGYRPSALNDGKGIRVQVAFHAIPPPLPPGKKKRKNQAKPAPQQSAFHFHEETDFPNFLEHVIEACERCSDTMDFKIVAGSLRTTNFSITWSIPRTQTKDMKLEKEKQFTDMVENAMEKAKPTIVLVVIEIKPEDEDEDSEEEEEMATQGKKKRSEPTPHEEKINEMIVTLQRNFPCKEIGCKSNFCWPDTMSGVHVPMTATHWNMWSSAIVEGVADVDEFNAPDTRLFQRGRSNDNEALLSRRATNRMTPPAPQPLQIQVVSTPSPPSAHSPVTPTQPNPALVPKIDLDTFCMRFELSDEIRMKLAFLKITGPHTLRYINNNELRIDGGLELGEVRDVRDAEERWLNGQNQ